MNQRHRLFGLYVPGDSALHRLPAGIKYLALMGPVIVALALQNLWVSLALVLGFVVVLLSTRISPRITLAPGWFIAIMAAFLLLYNGLFTRWETGVMLAANLVGCIYAARALTLTTPGTELVDVIVAAGRPLRFVGLSPMRFGLAVSIMLRSIPYLLGSFTDVRDAARARGIERNIVARVTPVVVDAVAYAQATGEALAARGIGDDD